MEKKYAFFFVIFRSSNLTDLVDELECLDESQSLVDRATDRQVVDGDLAQDALRINNEQACKFLF